MFRSQVFQESERGPDSIPRRAIGSPQLELERSCAMACYHTVTIMKAKTMVYLEPEQLEALRARARAQRISLAEAVRQAVRMSLDADVRPPAVAASAFRALVAIGESGRPDIGDRHDAELARALRRHRRVR